MYNYLEGLVSVPQISFPTELLKPMYELFLDLLTIYLPEDPNQRIVGSDTAYNQTEIYSVIINSNLMTEMR